MSAYDLGALPHLSSRCARAKFAYGLTGMVLLLAAGVLARYITATETGPPYAGVSASEAAVWPAGPTLVAALGGLTCVAALVGFGLSLLFLFLQRRKEERNGIAPSVARADAPTGRVRFANPGLAGVMAIKIALVLTLWAGPLLAFPQGALYAAGLPANMPPLYGRLLGVAFLALTVAYALGLRDLGRGRARSRGILGAVLVGIVSNGGSAIVLFLNAASWAAWPAPRGLFGVPWLTVPNVLTFSAWALALITLGLLVFGLLPSFVASGRRDAGKS